MTAPCDGVHGTWRVGWGAEPVHDLTDTACAASEERDDPSRQASGRER